jgi:hypothetical protein
MLAEDANTDELPGFDNPTLDDLRAMLPGCANVR